tara:strand:- start:539 stop:757 length:219 start_codon:yes stop_codon:yes gene_type:complete
MQKNNIKIAVTYEWEIDRMDWSELKAHQKTIENELEMKLEYDPTFMFYMLNDIHKPNLKQFKVNDRVRKVKS